MQHAVSLFIPKFIISFIVPLFRSITLAERLKRGIFVFSVMGVVNYGEDIDGKTIEDLNGRLRVAHNNGLCKASVKIKDAIWVTVAHGDDTIAFLPDLTIHTTPYERTLIIDYFVRNCPDWLRYGSRTGGDMQRDLNRLFTAILNKDYLRTR